MHDVLTLKAFIETVLIFYYLDLAHVVFVISHTRKTSIPPIKYRKSPNSKNFECKGRYRKIICVRSVHNKQCAARTYILLTA